MDVKAGGKNEGFSLIELVIVIGIAALLTGAVALSVGMLKTADTKGTADRINSAFGELKTENMAKEGTTYMNLYLHDSAYYIKYTSGSPMTSVNAGDLGKKIGTSVSTVSFNGSELGSGDIYSFAIRKKDGSLGDENGIVYYVSNGGAATPQSMPSPSEIQVKPVKSGTSHKIVIIANTGRHYVE